MSDKKRARLESNLLLSLSLDITEYLMAFLEKQDVLRCRLVSKTLKNNIGARWPKYVTWNITVSEEMLMIPAHIRTRIERVHLTCASKDPEDLVKSFVLTYPRVVELRVHLNCHHSKYCDNVRILSYLPQIHALMLYDDGFTHGIWAHRAQTEFLRYSYRQVPTLTNFVLCKYDSEDLSFLTHLTGLTSLVMYCWNGANLSGFECMTSLTVLHLSGYSGHSLGGLRNLTNLTWLNLDRYNGPDLDSLSNLTRLTKLCLWSYNHPNLDPVRHMMDLTQLTLFSYTHGNLNPLRNLTRLATLGLVACPNRFDWHSLALVSLTRIVVRYTDQKDQLEVVQLQRAFPNAYIVN